MKKRLTTTFNDNEIICYSNQELNSDEEKILSILISTLDNQVTNNNVNESKIKNNDPIILNKEAEDSWLVSISKNNQLQLTLPYKTLIEASIDIISKLTNSKAEYNQATKAFLGNEYINNNFKEVIKPNSYKKH